MTTAADIMNPSVVSASPDSTVRDVAKLLLDSGISAVPMLDESGLLLGMVSEGDLLGRTQAERLAGQKWWLALLSSPDPIDAATIEKSSARRVREIMHAPVVTVCAEMTLREVAETLRIHAVKRVPVMRDGRMVGIVSRADVLRIAETSLTAKQPGAFAEMITDLFGGIGAPDSAHAAGPVPAAAAPATADEFRQLVDASAQASVDEQAAAARAFDVRRDRQVKALLHDHLDVVTWDGLMQKARTTAAHGGKEIELLRFPSELCSDSGRKINNVDHAWAETLRGKAAEFYSRWERELKPVGFRLRAQVVDYPRGMPGNIALMLVWED